MGFPLRRIRALLSAGCHDRHHTDRGPCTERGLGLRVREQHGDTPEGEDEARVLNDTYLVIFQNTDGGWKLYREVASSNLPPQAVP